MSTSKLTTYCGVITAAASIVATYGFSPMVTKICSCIAAVATGVGLTLARDNRVSDEQAGAGQTNSTPVNKQQ